MAGVKGSVKIRQRISEAEKRRKNSAETRSRRAGYFERKKLATATYGTYEMISGSVSYDICPKGWRLPTGLTRKDPKVIAAKAKKSSVVQCPLWDIKFDISRKNKHKRY